MSKEHKDSLTQPIKTIQSTKSHETIIPDISKLSIDHVDDKPPIINNHKVIYYTTDHPSQFKNYKYIFDYLRDKFSNCVFKEAFTVDDIKGNVDGFIYFTFSFSTTLSIDKPNFDNFYKKIQDDDKIILLVLRSGENCISIHTGFFLQNYPVKFHEIIQTFDKKILEHTQRNVDLFETIKSLGYKTKSKTIPIENPTSKTSPIVKTNNNKLSAFNIKKYVYYTADSPVSYKNYVNFLNYLPEKFKDYSFEPAKTVDDIKDNCDILIYFAFCASIRITIDKNNLYKFYMKFNEVNNTKPKKVKFIIVILRYGLSVRPLDLGFLGEFLSEDNTFYSEVILHTTNLLVADIDKNDHFINLMNN